MRGKVITERDPKTLAFRRSSCERKRWFRSKTAAEIVGSRFGQRAYHCRFCDGHHLTAKENTMADGNGQGRKSE